MRFFIPIIAVFLIGTQESIAQEISSEESLRDRSRILKKVNPVSSETAEFSDFSELSASEDAEGFLALGYLWSAYQQNDQKNILSLLSRYNNLTGNFGYGTNLQYSFYNRGKKSSRVSIDIGSNKYDRRFESLQYLWDSEKDPSIDRYLPNTARFDVRNLETRTRHLRLQGQTSIGPHKFFLASSQEIIEEIEERLRLEFKMARPLFIEDSEVTFGENRKRKSFRKGPDSRTETVFGSGFILDFDQLKIRLGAVNRQWKRLRPGISTIQFEDRLNEGITLNVINQKEPVIEGNIADQNLHQFDFLEIRFESKSTEDSDDVVYLDTNWSGNHSLFKIDLSFGSLFREKVRENFEVRRNFNRYDGSYRLSEVGRNEAEGPILGRDYELGYFPSENEIHAHFLSNESNYSFDTVSSQQDSLSQDYTSYERVFGIYSNATFTLGDWVFLSGLRNENTKIETFGFEVIAQDDGSIEVSPKAGFQDYSNTFPTFSASYRHSKSSTSNLSWQRTIARPDYYDLIPYRIISRTSDIVTAGNPFLKPTFFEAISASWTKQIPTGVSVSAKLTSIGINDFFYSVEDTIKSGPYAGFRSRSQSNGTNASIRGFDFSMSKTFSSNFFGKEKTNIRLVHEYRESDADTNLEYVLPTMLPEVARNKFRFSLEQTIGKFRWLLQIDHKDKSIDKYGPNLSTFEYLDDKMTSNARFVYNFDQNWEALIDFINFGKTRLNETIGADGRIGQTTVDCWQSRMKITRRW